MKQILSNKKQFKSTSAYDSSSNGRTGTINSGTWKTGKFGEGVNLNGNTGSDISVGDF